MHRAELPARLGGDAGVLALGVDDQDGAVGREQVRDDGADALAGAGRGQRDQMGRTVVAQEPAGVGIAPNK